MDKNNPFEKPVSKNEFNGFWIPHHNAKVFKRGLEEKKIGVPYITDNNNTFIGQENLSPEEFERYAAETDIAFFKEELEKLSYDEGDDWKYKQRILDQRYDIQKKIDELSLKIPHEEEIERKEPAEDLAELQEIEEGENNIKPEDNSNEQKPVVFGQTILPAFVIMTDKGLKTFENARVLSFDENTNTFLLDNGKEKLQLPKETFETILIKIWLSM